MARKKKYENTTLEDILEILKSVKLPIFTLDRKWIVLFSGENRTKEMDKLEENVNKLLKSQGAVNSKKSELNQLECLINLKKSCRKMLYIHQLENII